MKYAAASNGKSALDAPASSCLEGVFSPWNVGPQRLRTTVIATMAMGVVVRALAVQLQSRMSTTPDITMYLSNLLAFFLAWASQTPRDIRKTSDGHQKDIREKERHQKHHGISERHQNHLYASENHQNHIGETSEGHQHDIGKISERHRMTSDIETSERHQEEMGRHQQDIQQTSKTSERHQVDIAKTSEDMRNTTIHQKDIRKTSASIRRHHAARHQQDIGTISEKNIRRHQ